MPSRQKPSMQNSGTSGRGDDSETGAVATTSASPRGSAGRFLKAGGVVGLAALCATGVASGIACPLLMGAAGGLAFSALIPGKTTRNDPAH